MDLSLLLNGLDDYLSLGRGSLNTLKQLCIGLYGAGTVNLQEVCGRFKEGKFASNTRKVERFFKDKRLNDSEVVRYIIDKLFKEDEALTLAIDRTDWSFGKTRHNLLIISVLYEKTAIPLVILSLEKKGNSHPDHRAQLLDKILLAITRHRIKAIIGDREFMGEEWFKCLKERHLPFVMRIRNNITIGKDDFTGAVHAFPSSQKPTDYGKVQIGSRLLSLGAAYSKDELVAVVSDNVQEPLKLYKQRWGIETGFKCLKSNGFNLEDTHIRHPERIKMLVQMCAIAMTLSFVAVRSDPQKIYKKTRISS